MRNKVFAFALLLLSLCAAAIAMAGSSDRFSYIYKRGNRSVVRIGGSFDQYKRVAKRFSGEYIWLYHKGRGYLIRDATVLSAVRGAFAQVDALEPKMREVEARYHPVERKYEELEERVDELSDRIEDDPSLERKLESQLREAERAMEALEAEYKQAERAVELVEDEMDRREEIAEKKFEEIVLRAVDQGKAERVD